MTISLIGAATADKADSLFPFVTQAVKDRKSIEINLASVDYMDGRFFGVLIGVKRQLARQSLSLTIVGLSPRLRRIFRLNRFEFLLSDG